MKDRPAVANASSYPSQAPPEKAALDKERRGGREGFRVSGLGFRVSGLGFWVLGLRFKV